jgi:hypothetical protein
MGLALSLAIVGIFVSPSEKAFAGGCTTTASDPDIPCAMAGLIGGVVSLNTAFAIDYLGSASPFVVSAPDAKPGQVQYGLWIRGIGGDVSLASTWSGISNTGNGNGPVSGKISLPTQYGGFQAGLDTGTISLWNSGWEVHGGVTFGYARAYPDLPPDDPEPSDESMRATLAPGFVGLYGDVFKDNFYANIQLRHVWQNITLNSDDVGFVNTNMGSGTWDLTTGVGYRIQLSTMFIEPSAGLDVSKTTFASVFAPGGLALGENVFPGKLAIGDIDTALGNIGGRVGTSFPMGNAVVQPSLFAYAWHEFAEPLNGQYISPTIDNTDLSFTRVGTFGQFGGGLAAQFGKSGVTVYAKASVIDGANTHGWNVGGGLRYSF